MKDSGLFLALAVLIPACFAANSTSVNWTATLTGMSTGSSGNVIFSGNTTMPPLGSGTISATFPGGAPTIPLPYTVTFSSGGTLTGFLSIPTSSLDTGGGAITASATVTGGSGKYAGYTGSFPTLTGTSSGSTNGSGPVVGQSNLVGMTITISGAGSVTLGGTPPPVITSVTDAASYSFSQVAPGSIFVVKGSGLSNPGTFDESFPLPTTSTNSSAGGVSITLTPQSGGAGTNAYLLYEFSQGAVNQLAAVLPSTLAAGYYNVAVTSNGITSPSSTVIVAAAKPELFTVDATGNGMALVENYVSSSEADLDRFTTGTVNGYTISPAHPGQTLIAYATGLGPVSVPDNTAAPAANSFGSSVQIIVGGMTVTPAYAGRAPGFAGLDQINFTLPDKVPTGCAVAIVIQENGVTGKQGHFISIAPTGSDACTYSGFNADELQDLDDGALVYGGGIAVDTLFGSSGGFSEISGAELPAMFSTAAGPPSQPGCTLYQEQVPAPGGPFVSGVSIPLDAGTITLNGPSGSGASNEVLTETGNEYSGPVAGLPAGTWTLIGSGGTKVGPFTASVTSGPPFTVTGGLPTNIVRADGFTLSWTGGNSTDQVTVTGITNSVSNGFTSAISGFRCVTTAGAGSLTVPASITSQLFAVSAAQQAAKTASSSLSVSTGTSTTFSAPLAGGGSISNATFGVGTALEAQPTYQ